jgi:hypothetical protein
MKKIIITEAQALNLSSLNKKMDPFLFKSYVKDYIKKLLKDPIYAKPDAFLVHHDLNGERLKKELEDAKIIVKKERVIDGNKSDDFGITYKVPTENFKRKLKRLYQRLFEENIIEGTILSECDCGGCMGGAGNAAFCNDSAPITPLTKEPLRRKKKLIITKEQFQRLQEEVVMDTAAGDFGYDAPGLKVNKKDPAFNHKNMIKKSFKGE